MKVVSYIRVSTDKQGRSGLGLEAQKLAIQGYARSHRANIVADYVEVESGTNNDRPELAKAIKHARVALLHKSSDGQSSPFPGRTYPMGSVTGMPRAV